MGDRSKGLYGKFFVERSDGSSAPGGKHHDCEYFCLDLVHDKYAVPALRAYAEHCATEYPVLASDLHDKTDDIAKRRGETVMSQLVSKQAFHWEQRWREAKSAMDSLIAAVKPFRDAFKYGPGESDLDNEQPITVTVKLGDWRRLDRALHMQYANSIRADRPSGGPEMSNRKPAQTAAGMDGQKIKVGNKVISKCGVICTVMEMWRQGYDGTIIRTDVAPDPDFPSHRQGAARTTYRLAP